MGSNREHRYSARAWAAPVSALVLAVAVFILWPHKPKEDDSQAMSQCISRLRRGIALYRQKHDHGPARLADLVSDGDTPYIPLDPITHAADWRFETEETVHNNDFSGKPSSGDTAYIVDVHSAAPGTDPSGKRYADY